MVAHENRVLNTRQETTMKNFRIEWVTIDGVRMTSKRRSATAQDAIDDLKRTWLIGTLLAVYDGRGRKVQ
jgi:hypothetical protein